MMLLVCTISGDVAITASSVVPYTLSTAVDQSMYKPEQGLSTVKVSTILMVTSSVTIYHCLRHENGTRCEMLFERYFESYSYFRYDPDSNGSCSYSECSEECSMILQHLKHTWGYCFHELTKNFKHQTNLLGFTVNYDPSHNFWHLCGI